MGRPDRSPAVRAALTARRFLKLCCHLSASETAICAILGAGAPIGQLGATGRVTGAHLHFNVYLNSTLIHPALLSMQ